MLRPAFTCLAIEPIFFQALQRFLAGALRTCFFDRATQRRLPLTLTFRPFTRFWTVSTARPASLELNVNLVPWPGSSVESPAFRPLALGEFESPPDPAGGSGSASSATAATFGPSGFQVAKPW